MYPNLEKSIFREGEYVGHGPLGTYRIRKVTRGRWRAELVREMSGIAYHGISGKTLRFISERISAGGYEPC